MRFIHLSDLHIGKRVNEFSMIEDQKYILKEITDIVKNEKADAVIIAGDIYDKSMPPAEAVQVFDGFLNSLTEITDKIFIINGNHDSAERIAFGSRQMEKGGVYIAPVFNGEMKKYSFYDSFGKVNIYLMPFIKPAMVRGFFEEGVVTDTMSAVKAIIDKTDINEGERNIIVSHQFITGAERSESEEIYVGGSDNVEAEVFDKFDYVALGHLHGPQHVLRETVRYCGTPLKYSFSETGHKKSITVVDMKEKGNVEIKTVPLVPLRDMRHIKGTYSFLTEKKNYEDINTEDYLRVTLLDEEEVYDAIGRLRSIYPNIMRIDYENRRTGADNDIGTVDVSSQKSAIEFFEELFRLQNNKDFTESQRKLCAEIMEEIWEVGK
ncbi:MAG: exonuclease SbcCD subunit D [Lachnospiraceae bacterium]|nr:exonuclease SbcCD subunit D [Lachnospiraceae bacterium]